MNARASLGYRGAQVLDLVKQAVENGDHVPSYAMIRDTLRFTDNAGVCRCIQVLERRGFIRRVGHGRQRRIRLLNNN